jgi:periplasmic protein TonB
MFESLEKRQRRSSLALLASGLLHCLLVYLWVVHPAVYVRTSSVAWGQHGRSLALVYFPRADESPPRQDKQLRLQLKHKKAPRPSESTAQAARAGSPIGSVSRGPRDGVEAKPALPLVFPDPPVYGWQLPQGLQGDVVVEVTIDEQGKVTDTKILQSLAQEIDDKIIAVLRNWRFKPATLDGVAISSRQDVHFHFPS